ncbi:MAG: HAD-IA family hydrolase [Sumerlaeia bacterium]
MFDWIFFDLDGTLWDHGSASAHALKQLCAEEGLDFNALAPLFKEANERLWGELSAGAITVQELRTRRFRMILDKVFHGARGGQVTDEEADRLSDRYLHHYLPFPGELEGASDALAIAAAAARVGVLTNAPHETQDPKLASIEARHHVEIMMASDDAGVLKPDPGFFERAEALAGHPPKERLLYVGDSWAFDMVGAHAVGWHCLWIGGGNEPPETLPRVHAVESIAEAAIWIADRTQESATA